MDISMLAKDADDLIRTNRVYADPIVVGDTTIIPAARVRGGGGAGGGSGPVVGVHPELAGEEGTAAEPEGQAEQAQESGEGAGGGLGFGARPMGAFIVKDGKVSWRPAVDVNRLMLVVGAVAIAAMLTARAFLKARPGG